MLKGKTIAIIGAGNMGSALIRALIARNEIQKEQIMAADAKHEKLEKLKAECGVQIARENGEAVSPADVVILAVKPQDMGEVLDEIAMVMDRTKLVVSIAAGVSTRRIEEHLPQGVRVIRVMPNTPALVGQGIAALCAGSHATGEDMAAARRIFDAVGKSCVLSEDLIDAVTGLSGSGPAYVFMFIEALCDAGVLVGLPRDAALMLSVQTVLGAAHLMTEMNMHPAQLREMVTSPGGTTIAGLRKMEEWGFRAAVLNAVEAATARSRELGW
ncbi:MAG: pyrroline-5-carboxylate reductase [Deltaproteobacteria bacterium]|nr:pyrroline-5-carboxylate reductase [Deltaproteobacteria bacterium]MBW2308605.1 pyrroline-5-carboxylate reductase [Deltaproteobacteria bacterium]